MPIIKRLSDNLINKIAAGEVIDRPASIVKELLENSIDAKSTKIKIELKNGGSDLIRISDNGIGMEKEDAILSLERHTTSKISSDNDLFSIRSLGFRGEALASIASISKLNLITRAKNSDIANEIYIEGGNIKSISDAGAPFGTMITIRDIFYNVPARKKFLKSVRTELGHITDVIMNMALCYPSTQFILNHNDRILKNFSSSENIKNRISDIIGYNFYDKLKKINYGFEETSIEGWISSPEISKNSANNYIFVNGRNIRDKTIYHAIFEGYKGTLMKGQYPIVLLFIKIPNNEVDINVHPSKAEVRFFNQNAIHSAVVKAIRSGIISANNKPWNQEPVQKVINKSDTNSSKLNSWDTKTQKIPKINDIKEDYSKNIEIDLAFNDTLKNMESNKNNNKIINNDSNINDDNHIKENKNRYQNEITDENDLTLNNENIINKNPQDLNANENPIINNKFNFSDLFPVGQIKNTYIVCESKKGMVLIDQHAAHERILFEKIKSSLHSSKIAAQNLLIPEIIEVNLKHIDIMLNIIPKLEKVGILIEHFGGNSFAIKSKPDILSHKNIQPLIFEFIENTSKISTNLDKFLDECIEIMACHGAIRAGQKLHEKEITTLLIQLNETQKPFQCPHGRPTTIEWEFSDLEKRFKRKT